MRKFKALVSLIIMAVIGLASCFFFTPKTNAIKTASANIEDKYYTADAFDLIGTNPSANITNGTIEAVAPFNTDTKQKMQGSSVTPNADEYGQVVNKEFKINDFMPETDDTIYMWVYLIDVITFKLKISITDKSSSTLVWEFNSMEVLEMGTGWKLLALNLSDFEGIQDYQSKTYSYIVFNYEADDSGADGEYDAVTSERFSFYHIFASNTVSEKEKSGKIHSLSTSFYAFAEDFPFGETVFVGDKIKIQSASEIFDYLYIGKYDLENYTSSGKYFWSLSIEDPDMVKTNVDFGDKILFLKNGYYNFNIKLYETGILSNKIVLNKDISVYSDEATLGKFSTGTKYKMKDNEKLLLEFKFSDNLTLQEDYEISLNNNKAEIDTYYEENGVLYVCVAGVSGGESTLQISAKGTSKFNDEVQTFTSSATIDIESTEKQVDVFLVIIWITFACFCVGIIIYLAISLVKARKNDVK